MLLESYSYLFHSPFRFDFKYSSEIQNELFQCLLSQCIPPQFHVFFELPVPRSDDDDEKVTGRPCGHVFTKGEGIYRCR
jgi:hypothetical protein